MRVKVVVAEGVQVVEQVVAFVFGDVVDTFRECLVDKEAFPSGDG